MPGKEKLEDKYKRIIQSLPSVFPNDKPIPEEMTSLIKKNKTHSAQHQKNDSVVLPESNGTDQEKDTAAASFYDFIRQDRTQYETLNKFLDELEQAANQIPEYKHLNRKNFTGAIIVALLLAGFTYFSIDPFIKTTNELAEDKPYKDYINLMLGSVGSNVLENMVFIMLLFKKIGHMATHLEETKRNLKSIFAEFVIAGLAAVQMWSIDMFTGDEDKTVRQYILGLGVLVVYTGLNSISAPEIVKKLNNSYQYFREGIVKQDMFRLANYLKNIKDKWFHGIPMPETIPSYPFEKKSFIQQYKYMEFNLYRLMFGGEIKFDLQDKTSENKVQLVLAALAYNKVTNRVANQGRYPFEGVAKPIGKTFSLFSTLISNLGYTWSGIKGVHEIYTKNFHLKNTPFGVSAATAMITAAPFTYLIVDVGFSLVNKLVDLGLLFMRTGNIMLYPVMTRYFLPFILSAASLAYMGSFSYSATLDLNLRFYNETGLNNVTAINAKELTAIMNDAAIGSTVSFNTYFLLVFFLYPLFKKIVLWLGGAQAYSDLVVEEVTSTAQDCFEKLEEGDLNKLFDEVQGAQENYQGRINEEDNKAKGLELFSWFKGKGKTDNPPPALVFDDVETNLANVSRSQ